MEIERPHTKARPGGCLTIGRAEPSVGDGSKGRCVLGVRRIEEERPIAAGCAGRPERGRRRGRRGESGKSGEPGEPDDPGPRHSAGTPPSPGFQIRHVPARSRRGWSAWRVLSAAAHRPPLASEATRAAGPSGVSCRTAERRRLGHSGATSYRSEAGSGPHSRRLPAQVSQPGRASRGV